MLKKSYQRFVDGDTFGIVSSVDSDIVVSQSGKEIFTGGLERFSFFLFLLFLVVIGFLCSVLCWKIRSGVFVNSFKDVNAEDQFSVCCMTKSFDGSLLAVGYSNGSIRVWDVTNAKHVSLKCVFTGHTKSVSCLSFNDDGSLLVSGSQSTEVIVWDVISETGRARLKGHKGGITNALFVGDFVVSSSKDTFVRLWDLSVQKCIQTLIGHRHEVWTMALVDGKTKLMTGSSDNKLRVWKVLRDYEKKADEASEETEIIPVYLEYMGTVDRSLEARVGCIGVLEDGRVAVQSVSKTVDVFQLNDEKTQQKKMKRRMKREREKKKEVTQPAQIKASDVFSLQYSFTVSHKLHRMTLHGKSMFATTNRNEVVRYRLGSSEAKEQTSLEWEGHKSDIRSVALNSNDTLLLSCSQNVVKMWKGMQCVSSCKVSGHGLCSMFLPGDFFAVVGTKDGKMDIISVTSSEVVDVVSAHQSSIWDMAIYPDKKGVVTVSADKTMKFWDFIIKKTKDEESFVGLKLNRSLTLDDDGLSVCFSDNGKYVAVSLLDSTVKVYYVDTLNFFLSLYGHKLPVLSISISSDSQLLVSGSADKNVKIWGLDFGDCHKSIFAHEDSITKVAFVKDTHYFFSASKDGTLKYFDADSHSQIQVLRGHFSEVWCFALSSIGDFVVSGSHDRSIRRWNLTEELLYPELEKEKEMEKLFAPSAQELNFFEDKEDENVVQSAAIQTVQSVKNAERLLESLDLAYEEWTKWKHYETALKVAETRMDEAERETKRRKNVPLLSAPEANPLLMKMSPQRYMHYQFSRIPISELDTCLILLPFADAMKFLEFCDLWLQESSHLTELICRASLFLIRTHLKEICVNRKYLSLLQSLKSSTQSQLGQLKNSISFNEAGFRFIKQQLKMDGELNKLLSDVRAAQKEKQSKTKVLY